MLFKRIRLVAELFFAMVSMAYLSAIFVDISYLVDFWTLLLPIVLTNFVIAGVLVFAFRLDGAVPKLFGFREIVYVFVIDFIVFLFNLMLRLILQNSRLLRFRWIGLNAILFGMAFAGILLLPRFWYSFRQYWNNRGKNENQVNTIVIGAGEAGGMLIRNIMESSSVSIRPVCILDDDPDKKGLLIYGVKVRGKISEVKRYAKEYRAKEIILALPSVSKKRLHEIVQICTETGLKVLTVPGISQIVNDEINLNFLREINISDLLGRDQIKVNMEEIQDCIENKVILVTGGGGSIGSELCRQIARCSPRKLIVFDIYENNAYDIEQELKTEYPDLDLLVLIGSIRDEGKVQDVFSKYRPQIVFNAAAHKHVPLMETSPNEAIKNNVFGTLNVARAADTFGAERFVQISTDKAVNPTNIMGASKRICEMIIQSIGRHSANTDFVAVRFGNVLGSNGSVIPLFQKQIRAGGPVTVTHKDIIRYFMTIPEAVSLVLQACCYATSGDIFVFDMGEPVRIYDLAENLIRLSGLRPHEDIKIVCTGLRPGEKLYEERLMKEEGMQKTANDLISIGKPIEFNENSFWKTLANLKVKCEEETGEMKKLVAELVPTYHIPHYE